MGTSIDQNPTAENQQQTTPLVSTTAESPDFIDDGLHPKVRFFSLDGVTIVATEEKLPVKKHRGFNDLNKLLQHQRGITIFL